MSINIISSLDVIAPLALLLLLVIGKRHTGRRDYIFLYLVVFVILHLSAKVLAKGFGWTNNLFIYHLVTLSSFGLLVRFFVGLMFQKQIVKWMAILIAIYLVFYLSFFIIWEDHCEFPSLAYSALSIAITTLCLVYYLKIFRSPKTIQITKSREFWHVTGLLSYFVPSMLMFSVYRILTEQKTPQLGVLWQLHNGFIVIMCIYFLIGYLCKTSENLK